MLKKETYLSALMVAKELEGKGLYLSAKPDSVLGQLMDASVSFLQPSTVPATKDLSTLDRPFRAMQKSAQSRSTDVEAITGYNYETADSQHSREVLRAVQALAPLLRAHIAYARNVVAPLVTQYREKLQAYAEINRPKDPLSLFVFQQRTVPSLLTDESFMSDDLGRVTMTKASTDLLSFSVKGSTEEEFYTSLVSLSNNRLDSLVYEWLSDKPAHFLRTVFELNFGSGQVAEDIEEIERDRLNLHTWRPRNHYDTVDVALCVYLMGRRLAAEVRETVSSVSLDKYKSELHLMTESASIVLMNSLRAIQRQISDDILVSEVSAIEKRLVVHKATYRSYLEQGGTVEGLLGLLVGNITQYNTRVILSMKKELESKWASYVVYATSSLQKDYMASYRDYAIQLAISGLQEPEELEKEYCAGKVTHFERVAGFIRAEFEKLDNCWADDLGYLSRVVIARARFYFTSAYEILSEMVEVTKANDQIDPREAAGLAVIKHFCSWVLPQLMVSK